MRQLFLLAGHEVVNGKGTGAHSALGDEAVEALNLRNALADRLIAKHGIRPIKEIPTDSLKLVIAWMRSIIKQDDVMIDLHFNAGSVTATGVEVLIPADYTLKEFSLASSLAEAVASTLGIRKRTGKLGTDKAGIKMENESQHSKLAVLGGLGVGINNLVEVCFITSPHDMQAYRANYSQLVDKMADAIAYAVKSK